jgi:hypothetical protein
MRRATRLLLALAVGAVALLVSAAGAAADHETRPHTDNMRALGHSPNPASFLGEFSENRQVSSDLAFWRNLVIHGNYDGFRILRRSPNNPRLVGRARCNGDQGDIVVWRDIVVRAWNSPAPADNPATTNRTESRTCDGQPVPVGFEGMHIWDISDRSNPELIGEVELSARPQADSPGCGTHTLTLVPDGDRAIIYNATSGGNQALPNPQDRECNWVDIIEVPLDDPGAARHLRREPLLGGHAPHDNGVILGDVNKLAVASGHMSNVFDIGANDTPGGSLEDPNLLFTIEEPGVCNENAGVPNNDDLPCNGNWHSASFTWDGEVIILGWEPGGGVQPECESTDPPVKKSAFFYDADTGLKLGQWTLPRGQDGPPAENCTIHNYNVVPLRSGRYVLVSGNYQAGTWVTEFTNPAAPVTLGWSDPPPLPQVADPNTGQMINELGGAWSSYWYNGFIYESEITKGLNVFRFTGRETRDDVRLDHLNPQTQEFTIRADRDDDDDDDDRDDDDDDDDRRGGDRDRDDD